MKYLRQFGVILGVTCAGELLHLILPLPVPASIYGLVLMLVLLVTGAVKLEHVDSAAVFLIEIMPVMFIPAGVGLVASWGSLRSVVVPVAVITVLTTFIVMAETGIVTDLLIAGGRKRQSGRADGNGPSEDSVPSENSRRQKNGSR